MFYLCLLSATTVCGTVLCDFYVMNVARLIQTTYRFEDLYTIWSDGLVMVNLLHWEQFLQSVVG